MHVNKIVLLRFLHVTKHRMIPRKKNRLIVRTGGRGGRTLWSRSIGCHHIHTGAVLVKQHTSVAEREQRMVAAHTDVDTGCPSGSALTNDDVAGDDGLAAELFHAETFAA